MVRVPDGEGGMRRAILVLALGLASAAAWAQGASNEEARPVRHSAHPAPAHQSNRSSRPLTPREKQLHKQQKLEAKRQKKLAKQQARNARRATRRRRHHQTM
jgi:hypothetical protein